MAQTKNKRKVLVLASTFPRWVNDTNPPFVYELSKRLAKSFDIAVLAPHFPGAKDSEVMDDLKVHRFHYFIERFEQLAGNGGILPTLKANKWYILTVPFFFLFEIIATLRLVQKYKPNIIHAHWIIPQGIAAYINWLIYKTPYVITSHGGDIYGLQNKQIVRLKKLIMRHAQSITVVSSAIKAEVVKIDPSLEQKTSVIPMGVDSTLFNPDKYDEAIKKTYNITGPFLLFVGRLAEKKGVCYLIEAMPAILKKYVKAKLLIIGSGPLEMELKKLTAKLKLTSAVIFVGAIQNSDLPKYYATADIFIGPSIKTKDGDTEGLGLTFVEAMLSGCQAIGTNTGGISDVVSKENLIESRSSKSISYCVTKCINLKDKSISFNPDISHFDWKIISNQYETIMRYGSK